jgi:hypothetical protein
MNRDLSDRGLLCDECETLLNGVIAAIRCTRMLLGETARAAQAGLIDDLDMLVKPADLNAAFDERQRARAAYVQHRAIQHGAQFPPR